MDRLVGYNGLIQTYALPCRPDRTTSRISARPAVKELHEKADGSVEVVYPHQFDFEDSLPKHIEFCLKYEGVNLEVLRTLFELVGPQPYVDWLAHSPYSGYARRAACLFEWLTGTALPVPDVTRGPYVDIANAEQYWLPPGTRVRRFRVNNNLPGTRDFAPLVRRTTIIDQFIARDLAGQIKAVLDSIDLPTLARAVDYMYLSETKSSYGIERETPTPERAARFRQLLEAAGQDLPLNEGQFTQWQNEIMEPARREPGFRTTQNWLGRGGMRYITRADFVPPSPADVRSLMTGLGQFCHLASSGMDPVIAATCAAYGFVFFHPFLDGNGRLHRFLLHHLLRRYGFTPPGVLVPISAAMYTNITAYASALKKVSDPVMQMLTYYVDEDGQRITVTSPQPQSLYAYFDATSLVEYTYAIIEQAVMKDLPHEVAYLRAYDKAYRRIDGQFDMPHHELDLYLKIAADNGGKLSKGKQKSRFPLLSDAQVSAMDAIVSEAFAPLLSGLLAQKHQQRGLDPNEKQVSYIASSS